MPFQKRHIAMLNDWAPNESFEPEVDRLLVTLSSRELLVVQMGPKEDEGTTLVLDLEYMPLNLLNVAHNLRHRTVPLNWRAEMYPWDIFVFDEKMTSDGPPISFEAAGLGWFCTIKCEHIIDRVEPVRKEELACINLTRKLSGLTFGEYNIVEAVMYNEALPKLRLC